MRVVVVGSRGQLGQALKLTQPAEMEVVWLDRSLLDVQNSAAVESHPAFSDADVVINATAYTAVDAAESDREIAFAVNADAVRNLALRAAAEGSFFIHVSTDYVFGGNAPHKPLKPTDPTEPDTVYGASKLAGEKEVLSAGGRSAIVRTAWVYSGNLLPDHGDFVSTMLRLEKEHDTITVVGDQIGNPTYVVDLANGLWELATVQSEGILHCVGGGEPASWCDFAKQVFLEAGADPNRVIEITSAEFPRPAPRPSWSVLDTSNWVAADLTAMPEWRSSLAKAIAGRV